MIILWLKLLFETPYCRSDAQKLEEWARTQNAGTLVDFSSRKGEVESILKDIAERAGSKEGFSYSRFFAIGLFRLLELANATEPAILEKVHFTIDAHLMILFTFNLICSLLILLQLFCNVESMMTHLFQVTFRKMNLIVY